nr:unnamed protein product [Callosobruchus analis]
MSIRYRLLHLVVYSLYVSD